MTLSRKEKRAQQKETGQEVMGRNEQRSLMYDFKLFSELSSVSPISSVPQTAVNCLSHNLGSVGPWRVMKNQSSSQPGCGGDRGEETDNSAEPGNEKWGAGGEVTGRHRHSPLMGRGARAYPAQTLNTIPRGIRHCSTLNEHILNSEWNR